VKERTVHENTYHFEKGSKMKVADVRPSFFSVISESKGKKDRRIKRADRRGKRTKENKLCLRSELPVPS